MMSSDPVDPNLNLDHSKILEFIPECLRELPLWKRIACLLSWVTTSKDVYDPSAVKEFFDTVKTQDVPKLERLVHSDPFASLFNLSLEERRTFLTFTRSIYGTKGTKRALVMVLSMLGATSVEIYEWFCVNQHLDDFGLEPIYYVHPDEPDPPLYCFAGPCFYRAHGPLKPCSFLLDFPIFEIENFGDDTRAVRILQNPVASDVDFEQTLKFYMAFFIHICVQLEILRLKIKLIEHMEPDEDIVIRATVSLLDGVCNGLSYRSPEKHQSYFVQGRAAVYRLGTVRRLPAMVYYAEEGSGWSYGDPGLYRGLVEGCGDFRRRYGDDCFFYGRPAPSKHCYGEHGLFYTGFPHGNSVHRGDVQSQYAHLYRSTARHRLTRIGPATPKPWVLYNGVPSGEDCSTCPSVWYRDFCEMDSLSISVAGQSIFGDPDLYYWFGEPPAPLPKIVRGQGEFGFIAVTKHGGV